MRRLARSLALLPLALLGLALPTSAAAHEFHVEVEPGFVGVEQTGGSHKFVFPSGATVNCPEAIFLATVKTSPVSALNFSPVYTKCVIGETPAPITTNGCTYRLSGETKAEYAPVTFECEAGKYIQVDVGAVCWARVYPQTAGKGAQLVNEGSGAGRDFKLSMTLAEISFETGGGLFCPNLLGSGKVSITGASTARGFRDLLGSIGPPVGAWFE